jgi:uncharacterized protein YeaO (DUF488 family)
MRFFLFQKRPPEFLFMSVIIKRVYDSANESDGERVLVDRLWPRGVSKEKARIDLWAKDIAPSDELRRWFSHDPSRWDEFRERYIAEVSTKENEQILSDLTARAVEGTLTLVYAARDTAHNNAVVLKEIIGKKCRKS